MSKMRVDHAMILNVVNQPADPIETMRALMQDNHEDERGRRRLSERAQALGDELVGAGVLVWLTAPDPDGRTLQLALELQSDFALNQPLASFALVAFALLDPESDSYSLDVLSVVEAILDDPFPVLMAQAHKARGEAVAEMKAQGIEYDERMELLEEVSYPKPLGEPLLDAAAGAQRDPSVGARVRPVAEVDRARHVRARADVHPVRRRSTAWPAPKGLVLRYLSNAYRALRHTVPEEVKTDELDAIVEWLGETVRQTDSSLLDEWEALTDPESVARVAAAMAAGEAMPPPRPITANARAFTVMVRNAMFQKVKLASRDDAGGLAQLEAAAAALTDPPGKVTMDAEAWEAALGAYWDEYESIGRRAGRAVAAAADDRPRPARGPDMDRAPDHRRPRGQPRLRDRGDGRPRRLGRGRRAGDPHDIVRISVTPSGWAAATHRSELHAPNLM